MLPTFNPTVGVSVPISIIKEIHIGNTFRNVRVYSSPTQFTLQKQMTGYFLLVKASAPGLLPPYEQWSKYLCQMYKNPVNATPVTFNPSSVDFDNNRLVGISISNNSDMRLNLQIGKNEIIEGQTAEQIFAEIRAAFIPWIEGKFRPVSYSPGTDSFLPIV